MKRVFYFVVLLFVFVCCKNGQNEFNRSNVLDCYIGKMRYVENPGPGSYWLFISALLVNNTNDTVYLYPEKIDSICWGKPCASYVQGLMKSDTITFEKIYRGCRIAPSDTSRLLLWRRFYEPKIADSLFLQEFEKIELRCEYDSFKSDNPKKVKDIVFHRTEKTKCQVGVMEWLWDVHVRMPGEPMDY